MHPTAGGPEPQAGEPLARGPQLCPPTVCLPHGEREAAACLPLLPLPGLPRNAVPTGSHEMAGV